MSTTPKKMKMERLYKSAVSYSCCIHLLFVFNFVAHTHTHTLQVKMSIKLVSRFTDRPFGIKLSFQLSI